MQVGEPLRFLSGVVLATLLRPWMGTSPAHNALFRPTRATFTITERCNSRCITCSMWQRRPERELNSDEVKRALRQLRDLGIRAVGFTGGEPTLRADMAEILHYARGIGFRDLQISTNGTTLNDSGKAKELLDCGLNQVSISLDGIGELNDRIRGVPGSYARTLSTIKTLAALRDRGYPSLSITVMTTLLSVNLDNVPALLELCRKEGCRLFLGLPHNTILPFLNVDLGDLCNPDKTALAHLVGDLHRHKQDVPSILALSHAQLEIVKEYFADPMLRRFPCHLGYHLIYIGPHGEVYSGCWALPPLGNIREEPLGVILAKSEYRARLKNMLLKRCPGCGCNAILNASCSPSTLWNDALWKLGIRNA